MLQPARNPVNSPCPELEPAHSRAICREIGEALRVALDEDGAPLPTRLCGLLDRLEKADVNSHQ